MCRRTVVTSAVGETSPDYVLDPRAPARVHAFDPRIKLIVILRDQVNRACSQWRLERERGTELLSFEDALDREASELPRELELLLERWGTATSHSARRSSHETGTRSSSSAGSSSSSVGKCSCC